MSHRVIFKSTTTKTIVTTAKTIVTTATTTPRQHNTLNVSFS